MSLKMKLTSTIMAFMLLASMLIVGVFAVKQTEFSVGGNIVFNASGINATISKGTLAGGSWVTESDADEKMKAVTINTEKSASQLAEEYESWSGLNLEFNEAGEDVTITFTVTNNSKKAEDSLVAYVSIDNGEDNNAIAYVENAGAIIAPDTDETDETENVETFVIRLKVIDKEINASLTGFKINFDIRYATVTADSATDTTLTYDGNTYTIGQDNKLTLSDYSTAVDLVIPAYIKNGDTTYTVTNIQSSTAYSFPSLKTISLPSTLEKIGSMSFTDSILVGIVVPDSVIEILELSSISTLKNIQLSKNLSFSGSSQGVFGYNSSLKHIEIPNGIEKIDEGWFNNNTSLSTVILPATVNYIELNSFYNCSSLKTIFFKGTEEQWNSMYIDQDSGLTEDVRIVFNYV